MCVKCMKSYQHFSVAAFVIIMLRTHELLQPCDAKLALLSLTSNADDWLFLCRVFHCKLCSCVSSKSVEQH